MPRCFLLDASALVPFFLKNPKNPAAPQDKAKAILLELLARREGKRAILRIPNFCMAECSKALASIIFAHSRSLDTAKAKYDQHVEALLNLVSKKKRGFIESYALQRKHLVNIEDIFKAQYQLKRPERGERLLSGLDGLVIAMGIALMRGHGEDETFIVTGDDWLTRVCNNNRPVFPKAINIFRDSLPD